MAEAAMMTITPMQPPTNTCKPIPRALAMTPSAYSGSQDGVVTGRLRKLRVNNTPVILLNASSAAGKICCASGALGHRNCIP